MLQSLSLPDFITMPVPRRTTTVETSASGAAALAAIEIDVRITALHEAAHACVAYCLGLEPKIVDASVRHGGFTQLGWGSSREIPETKTENQVRNAIAAAFAGVEAEKLILGQGTTGGSEDLREATVLALELIDSGLDPSAPLLSRLPFIAGELPSAVTERLAESVERNLRTQRDRSAALVFHWRASIIKVAAALVDAGRLADDRLDAVMREAGMTVGGDLGV